MINITVTADWQDSTGMDWVRDVYFPAKYSEALQAITASIDVKEHPITDMQTSPITWQIKIHLYGGFVSDGSKGLYRFAYCGDLCDRIEVSWPFEMQDGYILRHEICHMLLNQSGHMGWWDFGHGAKAGPGKDYYLKYLLKEIDKIYLPGHTYYPFEKRWQ